MICCQTAPGKLSTTGTLTVALAGNPNSGKTTIFNALTGLRQKVANYPGVTVEKKTGRCRLPDGRWASIVDLPGTYSLISRSPDEIVAMEVLRGLRSDTPPPDVVVVVVDASNLQRNLYLVSQLIEMGRPLVVALNMVDVAERRGLHVSPELLEAELGVPVVAVVGHKRLGIPQLKQAILRARVAPMPDWPLPHPMKAELATVAAALGRAEVASCQLPVAGGATGHWQLATGNTAYVALAERLLIGDRAADVFSLAHQAPIADLLVSSTTRMRAAGIDPMEADIEAHYRWIDQVAGRSVATVDELAAMGSEAPPGVLDYARPGRHSLSERIDAILIHKAWGLLIFAALMASLFMTIFWLASPIQDGIEAGIGFVGEAVAGWLPSGPLRALVNDGIFAGVGAVVVFVPQIALLFLFLSIMEDSGYLARAAFLMDRLLARVGLHGKSFIPLLSSFACAIPGIMATRTMERRTDRLATILIAPFMSCSARLPVYTLLIGTFFAAQGALVQAGIMLACYALGIVAAAAVAWIFRRSLLRGEVSAFILELPSYKVPQPGQVARHVWSNTWEFLAKAGTIIFCLSVVLWAMTYYPRLPQARRIEIVAGLEARTIKPWEGSLYDSVEPPTEQQVKQQALDAAQREYSVAGRVGRWMEPAIRPLGYDWKMGIGLVGAFAAREVFVSTLAITYGAGDGEETQPLERAMRLDRYGDGRPVWTPLVAVSLLIWFVLAMQCMSTLAVVKRETGGWRWPLFMLLYMNGLAYLICLGVYQIGRMV